MAKLPPGQHLTDKFVRFGLPTFAQKLAGKVEQVNIVLAGDVENEVTITAEDLSHCQRSSQRSDFHCVTTWSVTDLDWEGIRFSDFYEQIVKPKTNPNESVAHVVFEAVDGYRVIMALSDLMNADVMLADTLNGAPLEIDHGKPLRLVAPQHYGYKNAKHITTMRFLIDAKSYSFPSFYPNLMDHPRGRVAFEERCSFVPAWFIRPLYRVLIHPTRWLFRKMT